jgi:hypothetical protein
MKSFHWLWLTVLLVPWTLAGCGKNDGGNKTDASKARAGAPGSGEKSTGLDPDIRDARAKLSADDQELVTAQDFCAVQSKNRLGVMGVPFKVMVSGQPVFLCCDGCQEKALANPEKTLAKLKELRAKHNAATQ